MGKNYKTILGAILLLAVFAIVGYYALGSKGPSGGSGAQSSSGQSASDPNFFAGNVTTKNIPPGTYNGTGVYDHNCLPMGNGIYSCDAGIQIKNYGTIDFAYKHDMMMKPCIGPGDTLSVTILDSSGAATINRLTGSPNYS